MAPLLCMRSSGDNRIDVAGREGKRAATAGSCALFFALREVVVGEYKQFATSFTTIRAEDIRQQVEAIYARNLYWPEPLIQINPNFKRTTTVGIAGEPKW